MYFRAFGIRDDGKLVRLGSAWFRTFFSAAGSARSDPLPRVVRGGGSFHTKILIYLCCNWLQLSVPVTSLYLHGSKQESSSAAHQIR